MSNAEHTTYDDVIYPSAVYAQTHPDRLATMATLFGMRPTPVQRCRVLEMGCGDGSNLIAMAYGLPDSEFVGIDLAKRPIQKGQTIIEALGLKNITLRQLDILAFPPDLGLFDFILAHGLYSWVPAAVRDKILAICGESLSPCGVAYVSYNAYPGNHMRDMVRKMMQYHAGHFPESEQQVRQARALLKFLAESKTEPDVYRMLLKQELERVVKYTDAAFFHDDLSPVNHPVYFHEFAEHAARHGLRYLSEADVIDLQPEDYAPHVAATLRELDSEDAIAREQYSDFLRCRAFRQTLLCRGDVNLDRTWKAARVRDLYVAGEVRPASPDPDVGSRLAELFLGPKGAEIETGRPVVKTAFVHLGAVWPRHMRFQELLGFVRSQLARASGEPTEGNENDARELADALLQAYTAGFVELHAHAPNFVTEVSERPMASALARLQLREGHVVPTLRHTAMKIDDKLGRQLALLLDGTHDRAALLNDLSECVKSGSAIVCHEGKPVSDLQEAIQYLADELEANLTSLARSAILVA
jgi:methyltransferase-like protein/cyclopropane fatty-acyl-phospholipid synthase-like methyltransferase